MNGKEKCKMLKAIRRKIADKYGLNYQPVECGYLGNCAGTCARCDAELKDLVLQLKEKGIDAISINTMLNEQLKDGRNEILADVYDESAQLMDNILTDDEEEEDIYYMGEATLTPYFEDKILYTDFYIYNWKYFKPEEWWNKLYKGMDLVLKRDKNNEYGCNRILVTIPWKNEESSEDSELGRIIGCVPRSEAQRIIRIIDAGLENRILAKLVNISTSEPPKRCLHMAIYITWTTQKEMDALMDFLRDPML